MKQYLKARLWNAGKSNVVVQPIYESNLRSVDHKENAKALLTFLRERVPHQTLCHFGMLISRIIPKQAFQCTIYDAYADVYSKPKPPKFTEVSIDPDLLKVIKTHCPNAIKE